MPVRDIIVIGASAGGVEAVSTVARGLPADLPAAVFVVVHFPPWSRSVLPQILGRAGPLPAAHAVDGEAIRPGRIYVAPPGRHLLIHDGTVRLVAGPRENGAIPAVDPLFRSAARWHGERVIGVVLSGNLDDGAAGLVAIKHRGGVAVAQDPDTALYDGMPRSAVETARVDHVVPVERVGALLCELVVRPPGAADPGGTPVNHTPTETMDERIERESDIMEMQPSELGDDERPGELSGFTCPECHGALWEIQEGEVLRYRCRVGHGYSADAMLAEQGRDVEAALWIAFRALRERAALCRRMAQRMAGRGQQVLAARQLEEAADAEQRAGVLRQVLLRGPDAEQLASD
ncbi:chemotaxis protein CheB [Longimicrobium sp.]|uniref:chemotaxis protein CheB n=1 Tax=Longimicrobium sp. TaxID=2029185 RepID=UPI002E3566FE|nr:chemotaxis protein CheB [Longimicrobium sp.]HEX6037151.1 chemotaxis protein CheB [Longimicrobium sp.]